MQFTRDRLESMPQVEKRFREAFFRAFWTNVELVSIWSRSLVELEEMSPPANEGSLLDKWPSSNFFFTKLNSLFWKCVLVLK